MTSHYFGFQLSRENTNCFGSGIVDSGLPSLTGIGLNPGNLNA